jgi:hypothetical protein
MSKRLAVAGHCDTIAARFESALAKHGRRSVRSFDLQSARAASTQECPCPYHHTTNCTCQYLVLIVYSAKAEPPCTVVLHEFESITRVTLDDPDDMLANLILDQEVEAA